MKNKNMIVGASEAARYTNRSRVGIYKLMAANKLHPIQPYRGQKYFDRRELDKFVLVKSSK